MQYGHNTNVTVGDITYHVQTEDRGPHHALIDTTVHCRGRVMHRRTNNYFDLLPLDADRELALKIRVAEQHRNVIEEMRSGTLHLPPLPPEPPPRPAAPAASPRAAALKLELLNSTSWLNGKRASLQILVRDAAGAAVSGANVSARVDGAEAPAEFLASSDAHGRADLEFDMPRLAGSDVALLIQGRSGSAQGQLRFSLRAKPKVPSAQ
jgi:hypothetical protein